MSRMRSLLWGNRYTRMCFSPTTPTFGRRFLTVRSPPDVYHRIGCRTAWNSLLFGNNVRQVYPLNWLISRRYFSSGSAENVSSKDGIWTSDNSMLEKLTKALNEDEREQMSRNEFISLTLHCGIDTNSVEKIHNVLVENGTIMDFGKEFGTVVIKPERAKKAWDHALDLDRSHTIEFISRRKVELEALRLEIEPLEVQLKNIEQRSEKSAKWWMRGLFGYTIVHTWLIAWLTFYLLSWDIMEPITYLVNLYTFVIAVYFFNSTSCDFTFDAMKDTLKAIKRRKLFHQLKFDEEEYDRLKREIYLVEQDLYNPEWFVLNEVLQEDAGTMMQNPEKLAEGI